MKKIKLLLAFCSIIIMMVGCKSSSMSVIGFWAKKDTEVLGKKRSLFIMVLAQDLNARNVLETDLKAAAEKRGLKTVTSIEALGAMNVGKNFPVEAILAKVKELKLETIFTVAVKDIRTESHYVQASQTYYNPVSNYGYYGNFGSYYGNYWGSGLGMMGPGVVMSTGMSSYNPGYTVEKKTIYLESNLYDTQSQELLMSIQTKAVDPESIAKASKKFTSEMVKELDTEIKLRK